MQPYTPHVYLTSSIAWGSSAPSRKHRVQTLATDVNRRRFKTGTKIIREWNAELHEVAFTVEGYLHNGELYKSLLPISFPDHENEVVGPSFLGTISNNVLRLSF
jgi:Protein of unknown function (DUF2924)